MPTAPLQQRRGRGPRARLAAGGALLALATVGALSPGAPAAGDRVEPLRTARGQLVQADELRQAARLADTSVSELRDLLVDDPTVRLHENGRVAFADFESSNATASGEVTRRTSDASWATTQARAAAKRSAVALSSRPSSPRTLYLDFDGEEVCNTEWNDNGLPCGTYAGYDTDGSPGFSAGEQKAIREAWARVAEDYAPFNINVTTVRPPASDLSRTSNADQRYGVHAVVTSSVAARNATCGGPGCAGVALLGVFPRTDANHARIIWAFSPEVNNSPRQVADVVSHEAGHTLGLEHQGTAGGLLGFGAVEYYAGHGIWAPLMGSSLNHLTQWSASEYNNPSRNQDDIALITSNGAPLVRDDHPNGVRGVERLRRKVASSGVISTRADRDVFKIVTTCRAKLRVSVTPAANGPNLDAALSLRRAGRTKTTTKNPGSPSSGAATGLSASISGTYGIRGKATWYVTVDGVGARDPLTTGYSDYGSLGAYAVRATGRCVKG
ncbi:hypothetical protein ACLM5J_01015 [Nocardioides sp. Bht2]|uniref:hypothetical protein n=1 Tax=Nocardioides sp. Bht2 TaxID=3392297 RepID=UPI0039B4F5DE